MTLTLHGIPHCDTVQKARAWLAGRGIEHAFHDYKKLGIDAGRLGGWVAEAGWEALLNRAGTTFRGLPESAKRDLDADRALALMIASPSLIRRPVVTGAGALLIGFKPEVWATRFP
jgi:Spx/MgsR family transcriptional regulator